ncbi:hypothetical protein NQ317_005239 [Molorchus minor]|uniref:Uncharacterized protein n=1 Tax=Molorchus minor TaxID=1323400 RepID=A0ABQ9JSG7_9CUCU|nr:hypothetical protein NQ317_005239 [Molorchus minor]
MVEFVGFLIMYYPTDKWWIPYLNLEFFQPRSWLLRSAGGGGTGGTGGGSSGAGVELAIISRQAAADR